MDSQDYDDSTHSAGGGAGGGSRWNAAGLDQMDFVCTFLDNEEDHLPELFDVSAVEKRQSSVCELCNAQLASKVSSMLSAKDKSKHHCRRCGRCVCNMCSQSPQRRLSKQDKKKYRVCDECDTLMSNVNFE